MEELLRAAIEMRVGKKFPKLMLFRVQTAAKSTSKTGSRPGTMARPWKPSKTSKNELLAIIGKHCITRAPARVADHPTPFKVRARARARRAQPPSAAARLQIFSKDVATKATGKAPQRGFHGTAVLMNQLFKEALRIGDEAGHVELNGCGDSAWGVSGSRGAGLVCDRAGLKKVRTAARRLLKRHFGSPPAPRAPAQPEP